MHRWSLLLVPAVLGDGRRPRLHSSDPAAAACARVDSRKAAIRARWARREGRGSRPKPRPSSKAENPALQPLPAWPQQREKTLQFFQLNGYIRFRAYLFHNAQPRHLAKARWGPQSPFSIPYTEFGSTGTNTGAGQPGVELRARATRPTAAPTT